MDDYNTKYFKFNQNGDCGAYLVSTANVKTKSNIKYININNIRANLQIVDLTFDSSKGNLFALS